MDRCCAGVWGLRLAVLFAGAAALPGAEGGRWGFAPAEPLWSEYLADPRRPRMAADQLVAIDSELGDRLDVGAARFDLALGERVIVARYAATEWSIDVMLEAGFFGQFDQAHQLDSIGWDGVYGVHLVMRRDQRWALKLAYRHLSSHLGDELIVRTGIDRREYTRDDLSAAAQWNPLDGAAAVYGEVGVLLSDPSGSEVEPLVAEVGAQYQLDRRFGEHWISEVGLHVSAFQDDDFEPNLNLVARLIRPDAAGRESLEFHAAAYTGRAQIGELADARESHLSVGFGWNF